MNLGIEATAIRALDAKKVKIAIFALGFAIVAHNIDDPGEVGRHRLHSDIPGASGPSSGHRSAGHHRLFADWAAVVEAAELAETVGVDGVAAR